MKAKLEDFKKEPNTTYKQQDFDQMIKVDSNR